MFEDYLHVLKPLLFFLIFRKYFSCCNVAGLSFDMESWRVFGLNKALGIGYEK